MKTRQINQDEIIDANTLLYSRDRYNPRGAVGNPEKTGKIFYIWQFITVYAPNRVKVIRVRLL